jgi:hypothetical protein
MPPGPTGVGSAQDEDIWRGLDADELGASEGAAQHSGADAASQGGSAISSIPAYLVKPVRTRPPRKEPTELADLLARLCSGDEVVQKLAFQEARNGIYNPVRRSKKTLEVEASGTEAEEGHDRNGGGSVAPTAAAKRFGHIWRDGVRDAAAAASFLMRRANPGTPDATPRGPVSIVTDRVVAAKTPKTEDVLRAVAASDAAAALMSTGLADAVGSDSLPTSSRLPKHVYERMALLHESKKITNDGLSLAAAAHGQRIAKPAVQAATALLDTVEKVSWAATQHHGPIPAGIRGPVANPPRLWAQFAHFASAISRAVFRRRRIAGTYGGAYGWPQDPGVFEGAAPCRTNTALT